MSDTEQTPGPDDAAKTDCDRQEHTVGKYTIIRKDRTVTVEQAGHPAYARKYRHTHAAKCAFGRLARSRKFVQTWVASVRIDMIKAGKL